MSPALRAGQQGLRSRQRRGDARKEKPASGIHRILQRPHSRLLSLVLWRIPGCYNWRRTL